MWALVRVLCSEWGWVSVLVAGFFLVVRGCVVSVRFLLLLSSLEVAVVFGTLPPIR